MSAVDFSQGSGPAVWFTVALCLVATATAGLRWLRVAQREHYLSDATARFALRWWFSSRLNAVLAVVAVAGMSISKIWPVAGLVTAVAVTIGPVGLSVRGRTSSLAWTRRLRTLAAVWVALEGAIVAVGFAVGSAAPAATAGAVLVPVLIDMCCVVTAPFERRLAARFVSAATERLRVVAPLIVGITGSYGKTSTKNHLTHLLGGTRAVVASPRSFNNRAGLARAVNEHLADGTEIFVAEMGTYGPGEIAELCQWCPPQIAVITAIGPVHLERFGTEDRIAEAKAEITVSAKTVVLNIDVPRLGELARRITEAGPVPEVVRCSAVDLDADVAVERTEAGVTVHVGGREVAASIPVVAGVQPTNLACAIAVALRLGTTERDIGDRLATLPPVANRLAVATAPSGVVVLDDTFNSNPAGAGAALRELAALRGSPAAVAGERPDGPRAVGGGGRRVVVTPGMIELGGEQRAQNERFAASAVAVATDLVIVGRTNRRALLAGAAAGQPGAGRDGSGRPTKLFETRDQAVAWVRANLGPGDAVLYENDLPDHYP